MCVCCVFVDVAVCSLFNLFVACCCLLSVVGSRVLVFVDCCCELCVVFWLLVAVR